MRWTKVGPRSPLRVSCMDVFLKRNSGTPMEQHETHSQASMKFPTREKGMRSLPASFPKYARCSKVSSWTLRKWHMREPVEGNRRSPFKIVARHLQRNKPEEFRDAEK